MMMMMMKGKEVFLCPPFLDPFDPPPSAQQSNTTQQIDITFSTRSWSCKDLVIYLLREDIEWARSNKQTMFYWIGK